MSKARENYENDLKTREAAYKRYINDPYNGCEDINTYADIFINELEEQNKEMRSLLDELFNIECVGDIHNLIAKFESEKLNEK
jgi:hypothetical protein